MLQELRPFIGSAFREPGPLFSPAQDIDDANADRVRRQIEELLGPSPVEVDELIRQSGASASAVLTLLLELELAGRLHRHPGNRVAQSG